jgi:hypothetical protein
MQKKRCWCCYLINIAATEHAKRPLMQVHDGKVLSPHCIHSLVALDANKEECAQLSSFFEHGNVALREFVTAASKETKAVFTW